MPRRMGNLSRVMRRGRPIRWGFLEEERLVGHSDGSGGSTRLWALVLEVPKGKESMDTAPKANFPDFTLFVLSEPKENLQGVCPRESFLGPHRGLLNGKYLQL